LLEHAVETLRGVAAIERVAVVLGADADRVRAEADLSGVEIVVAEDWAEGIAASLRAGVAALADADAVLVTLADQPLLTRAAIEAVLAESGSDAPAARATYDGKPGHPVLIKRELYPEVAKLRGDAGARDLLTAHGAIEVECGELSRADDVDTPGDLEIVRHLPRSAR
jgi:CTP:molybdopterin cytidylyltransferase MocA